MKMLKPLALFILILCTIQPNNAEDVIEETCNKAPRYFSECVKYVKSYPSPRPASPVEVAIILFNIMRYKATITSTKISKLLAGGKVPPGTRQYFALEQCATSYKETATFYFHRGRGSLAKGEFKDALDAANGVLGKIIKCELSFYGRAGGDIRTPLTDENSDMILVASIAAAIVESFVETS